MTTAYLKIEVTLAKNNDLLIAPGVPNYGQVIFVRSTTTGMISGPHVLDKFTNMKALETYFKKKYVYVAANGLEADTQLVFQDNVKDWRQQFESNENQLKKEYDDETNA